MLFVNQMLAHLTGPKSHSDILVYENSDIYIYIYENSDISTLTEKDISIILYLNRYVFGTFYKRLCSTKSNTNSYYHQQCLPFLIARKCSGENLPLPERKHIEIKHIRSRWAMES